MSVYLWQDQILEAQSILFSYTQYTGIIVIIIKYKIQVSRVPQSGIFTSKLFDINLRLSTFLLH